MIMDQVEEIMAFIMAAGFASSRTSVLSSTETIAARVQPAPRMQQMGIGIGYDSLLNRISTGICDSTSHVNHLELRKLVRRADAECQLGATLSDLKARMARKTAVRTLPASADGCVELYYKAS
jgi:hypothetical protein